MTMNTKTVVILGIASALLIMGAIALFLWPFVFRPPLFRNEVLAENVTIGPEWTEIDFRNPVRVDKDNIYVGIYLEPPYFTPLGSKGIKTPEGQIVNPEITLIDENGKE